MSARCVESPLRVTSIKSFETPKTPGKRRCASRHPTYPGLSRTLGAARQQFIAEAPIQTELADFRRPLPLLQTIPGIDLASACMILVEIGPDLRAFRQARHLGAWAGVAPGLLAFGRFIDLASDVLLGLAEVAEIEECALL